MSPWYKSRSREARSSRKLCFPSHYKISAHKREKDEPTERDEKADLGEEEAREGNVHQNTLIQSLSQYPADEPVPTEAMAFVER